MPSRRIALRTKAEVGERAVDVPVANHSRDVAVVDVQEERSLRLQLRDLEPTYLAASPAAVDHEHSLAVDFTKLVHQRAVVLPRADELAPSLSHPAHSGPA